MSIRRTLASLACLCALAGCDSDPQSFVFTNTNAPLPSADRIYVGGPILTINPAGEAEAVAIRGNRILAVGSRHDVMATQGEDTKVVDLQGKTLMPAFVEPHVHPDTTALDRVKLDLSSEAPMQPLSTVISKLTSAVAQVPAGQWLQASGFDPSRTDPLFATLTLATLDGISSEVPIFVLNASEHIAYVNSKGLELAGITASTPNPPGGTYVKDGDGNLTGQLNEASAIVSVASKIPTVRTPDQVLELYRETFADFNRAGVISFGDLGTGLAQGVAPEIGIYQKLTAEPTNSVRLFSYIAFTAIPPNTTLSVTPNEGNDVLRFIGIKFTLDGSTQGFSGALNEPYLGTTNRGELLFPSTDALYQNVLGFAQQGWQIAMHCNGDRSLDQAIDVHQRLREAATDITDRRHRIEHLTVTSEAQLDRVAALDLTASFTIGHIFYWGQVFHDSILGPERANRIDATASLRDRGVRFSLNSDSTTTTVEPLRYVENAVTRIPQLTPPAVLGPEQRITVDEALRAVTLDAAYQLFADDRLGSLEVGKFADFIILSGNPRTVDPSNIREIDVLETYMGGRKVF